MNLEPMLNKNFKKTNLNDLEIGPETIPELPLGNENLNLNDVVSFNKLINFLCIGYANSFKEKFDFIELKMEKNL